MACCKTTQPLVENPEGGAGGLELRGYVAVGSGGHTVGFGLGGGAAEVDCTEILIHFFSEVDSIARRNVKTSVTNAACDRKLSTQALYR